jgi:glycosyltransferase involved in cell wall biosynthesis
MKICWFGIYDRDYSRNDILISGLRANGIEVVECRADWRDPMRYRKLIRQFREAKKGCDIIYAAYPAPVPTILAKIITLFSGTPVVMDAFYSMYDAVVNDRREVPAYHPRALKLLILDWLALLAADAVIADTEEHKKYWSSWLFVSPKKIRTVYVGVNDARVYPIDAPRRRQQSPEERSERGRAVVAESGARFLIHFHGKNIPLQGVDKILAAADLLAGDSSIRFRMIGAGRTSENIECLGRVPFDDLNRYMAEADAVLGVFGDGAKARRVIPNKIYEGLAAGKPVITMDTAAVREVFSDSDLVMVAPDPSSIAAAIRKLRDDPALRQSVADSGYAKIRKSFTPQALGARLRDILTPLLSS